MSRPNLYKSGWFMINQEEVRKINSNEKIAQKIGSHFEDSDETSQIKPYTPDSFDTEEDRNLARLFGEEAKEGMSGADDESERYYNDSDTGIDNMEEGSEAYDSGEERDESVPSIEEINAQAAQILEDANEQAKMITEQAEIMSQQQAQQAYEQAKSQGVQDGYQEGFQKAALEGEAAKQEFLQKQQELTAEYDEKLAEMEPYLIEELTGIYEHIFGVELSQYKSLLTHLVANTLHSVENSSSYLIHVSSQDYSFVSMQKAQIMEEGGVANVPFEIIEDVALAKNECLIETENGIFDCSLSVQLTELKRKLLLLSYNGKKE